jgi:hypothetical protein
MPICLLLSLMLLCSQGSSALKGGVGFVHVPTQVQPLQAKVIARLLEPERLAWKVFQLNHLSQASQVQPLGYRASILFRVLNTDQLQLPAMLSAYVAAFRDLDPPRGLSVTAMLPSDVFNEPLLFNRQTSQPAASSATTNSACPVAAGGFLTSQHKPLTLSAGITEVAHQRLSLQLHLLFLFFSFLFSFFAMKRHSLHEATIAASKKRDTHCIP